MLSAIILIVAYWEGEMKKERWEIKSWETKNSFNIVKQNWWLLFKIFKNFLNYI